MPTIKITDNTVTSIYDAYTLIIFVSCVAVIISFIGLYIVYLFFKRRYLRYLRQEQIQLQNRQLQERLINVENIEITFVS
jgi:membrane protein implicated in regulation of membrane protease activity